MDDRVQQVGFVVDLKDVVLLVKFVVMVYVQTHILLNVAKNHLE